MDIPGEIKLAVNGFHNVFIHWTWIDVKWHYSLFNYNITCTSTMKHTFDSCLTIILVSGGRCDDITIGFVQMVPICRDVRSDSIAIGCVWSCLACPRAYLKYYWCNFITYFTQYGMHLLFCPHQRRSNFNSQLVCCHRDD